MRSNWSLVTAGFGSDAQVAAADRVVRQASELSSLKIRGFKYFDLPKFAPECWTNYREFLNTENKGFGYFSWKPELVWKTFESMPEQNSGVIWVDAGCEININNVSKIFLRRMMKKAERDGYFLYSLRYPENAYTKKLLFAEFGVETENDSSPQVQATWFLLYGELGREIAKKWFEVSKLGIEYLDLSRSTSEHENFIEHRFDQSVLSLTAKNLGCKISNIRPPDGRSRLSRLRGYFYPIWSSRNRTGESLIKD